jgi:hypothetical protein
MFGMLPFWNSSKGAEAKPTLSDERALLTQSAAGEWYHLAKQGMVFTGNMAATGVVLPIFSSTSQVCGIWNPAGSGVNAVLMNVRGTYVDTTGAAGGYCLAIMKNAGSALATGGISAFTETTPERGLVGNATGGNKVRWTGSAATVIAPAILRQLGINQTVITAATTSSGFFTWQENWQGDLVIAPNNAVFLAGNIATLAKLACSLTWAEIPV